jgi:hypothetical protein
VARLDARGEVVIDRGLVWPGDRKTSERGIPGSSDADTEANRSRWVVKPAGFVVLFNPYS